MADKLITDKQAAELIGKAVSELDVYIDASAFPDFPKIEIATPEETLSYLQY